MKKSRKVIRVLLGGGLGNQLFQYAYGRAIAMRCGGLLELERSRLFMRDPYRRRFELDAFSLKADAVRTRSGRFPFTGLEQRFREAVNGTRLLSQRSFISEPPTREFRPEYAGLVPKRSVLIHGYWQCEGYFGDVGNTIRKELRFSKPISERRKAIAYELERVASVAIHVRQVQYDRALDSSFYQKAIAEMRRMVPNARFYIFADDPCWWGEKMGKTLSATCIENNGFPAIEDFKLMACCRHFIIANSSFSWWAAWLGKADDKVVIAPGRDRWSNPDTVPASWKVV